VVTGDQEVGAFAEPGRALPRRFLLLRHKDISGISGTRRGSWRSGLVVRRSGIALARISVGNLGVVGDLLDDRRSRARRRDGDRVD
jgi:hypothetical protein